MNGFVVVNSLGKIALCMHDGKTLHHAAIWVTEAQAERFAEKCRKLNRKEADIYTVKPAEVML